MRRRLPRLSTLGLLLLTVLSAAARADDWPQWLGPKRDGVWRETGVIDKFPAEGLKPRWRTPIGAGYSAPAVAGGRVYVTDRQLKQGAENPRNPFERPKTPGIERVLCLDEKDGKVLWKDEYACAYTVSYAAGPRAAPAVAEGRVYTVGTEGDVRCYDAQSGKVVWKAKLGPADGSATPVWGFAASPLVDGQHLICIGDASAVVVAFNRESGAVEWKALSAREPGYCPPVIYTVGGKRQLIAWHSDALVSLDPQTGRESWSHKLEVENGLAIAMPRLENDLLFISSNYEGSAAFQFEPNSTAPRLLWQRGGKGRGEKNRTLYALMCTPFVRDGHVYGVSRDGALMCLKAENGDVVWQTFDATTGDEGPKQWATAFLIEHAGAAPAAAPAAKAHRFFIFNEGGDLITADLAPTGYRELSRTHVIDPVNSDPQRRVVWSYPAFADRCVFVRNDQEIICYSLAAGGDTEAKR